MSRFTDSRQTALFLVARAALFLAGLIGPTLLRAQIISEQFRIPPAQ